MQTANILFSSLGEKSPGPTVPMHCGSTAPLLLAVMCGLEPEIIWDPCSSFPAKIVFYLWTAKYRTGLTDNSDYCCLYLWSVLVGMRCVTGNVTSSSSHSRALFTVQN